MDVELPYAIRMLKATVRRFVEEKLIPLEPQYHDQEEPPDDVRADLEQQAKALGIWALDVPKAYGGSGLGFVESFAVREEMARTFVPSIFAPSIIGLSSSEILYHATPLQRERYLEPLIRGEKKSGFLLTEPNGGSDPAGMQTWARRENGHWVLHGRKIFVSYAHKADFCLVFAVTDREKRARGGITCFLVDKGTPGYTVERVIPHLAPNSLCEAVFDNCVVDDGQVLGEVGRGFYLAQEGLTPGRAQYGPISLGIAERAHNLAVQFAKQRFTFGKPLSERQAIQFMVADNLIEMHAVRLMAYDVAAKLDAKQDPRQEAAMVKFMSTEMVGRVVDRAIQIHGALGLVKDLPLERFYREIRGFRIGNGANEIQRMYLARLLLSH